MEYPESFLQREWQMRAILINGGRFTTGKITLGGNALKILEILVIYPSSLPLAGVQP
jgi:hypothetical protein